MSWQELYLGLFTELGKLHINDKGNAQSKQSRDRIPIAIGRSYKQRQINP